MSGQGLSCLLRWAVVCSTASQSHSSCLSPLQCWDSPPLPPSAQPPLGCWQRSPQVLGMEKKERRAQSSSSCQRVQQWLGARDFHGWCASVSPPTVLASPPCARLATLVCHQAGSYPPWQPALWPGHHAARAMRFPWGTRVSLAKLCYWKKACTGALLEERGTRLECQNLWQPVVWGHSCDSSFHLFSLFLKSPGQMDMMLQVLCFCSGMLKEEDL